MSATSDAAAGVEAVLFGVPITQRHPPLPTPTTRAAAADDADADDDAETVSSQERSLSPEEQAERAALRRFWWRSTLRIWVVEPYLDGDGYRYLTLGESFGEREDLQGLWELHLDPCCQNLWWRNNRTEEWFWRPPWFSSYC